MRRIICMLIAGLLLGQLMAAEQVYAASRSVIISGSEYDYPPFCVVSPDGKADGFSVELLRASLSAVNLDVEFKTGDWDALKKELSDGSIQVLPLVGRTPEREAIFDFTFPYLTLHGAVFVRKGDTRITKVSDLQDKTVVVMRGDNAEEFARRTNLSSHIVTVDTYAKAMQMLEAGKYDAVIAQRLMGIYLLNKIGIKKVVPLDFDLNDLRQDFCFAVREGDKNLLSTLNEGLSIVVANGTFSRLHQKWFGALMQPKVTFRDVAKYVLIAFITTLALMTFLLIFMLRLQVKRKTRNLVQEIAERKHTEEALRASEASAKRLARENELIAEIVRIFSSTLNIEDVYDCFAEKMKELIPFDRIAINTINLRDNTRTIRYVNGDRISGDRPAEVFPIAGTWTEHALTTKSSLLINSKNREDVLKKFPGMPSRRFNAQSTMLIPLISNDELTGILGIHSADNDAYSENDLRLAEIVGSHIAGTIAKAQLLQERMQAEEDRREKDLRYRMLFDKANDGIFIIDREGRILDVNSSFAQMHGYTIAELLEKGLFDLDTPETVKLIPGRMKRILDGEVLHFEVEHYHKDRHTFQLNVAATRIELNGQAHVLCFHRDMTEHNRAEEERRRLEERLHRSEKMESLGQLAGGVAHDLNNVLGILSGYSELLLEEIPEKSRSRSHIEKIMQSTEKGAAIIQDLLTLARRGVTISDVTNLNTIVSDYLKTPVLEKLKDFYPHVTIIAEYDENLLNIKGSPVHLEKTLMNLVSNAVEAIAGEGKVRIKTESCYLDKPLHGYDDIKEGDYSVLTVSDTGAGISAEDREKIFEPFYTKKKMGRSGTGLGLSIVWGTVKDHNGYIDVQTDVGKGATFMLYFPATREGIIAPQEKELPEQYMGNGESVLVVDDIAEQREIASKLLASLGYRVHLVVSGEDAVEYLKSNTVDMLVLDMIMDPGIDGLETYRRTLAINPQQKAIIVSGFSETERVKEAQKLGAGAYIKKPYLKEKIGVAIRDELARK